MHQSAAGHWNSKAPGDYSENEKVIDEQIENSLRAQEMSKLRSGFQAQIRNYYMNRKAKEYITLQCSQKCFNRSELLS